MATTIRLLSTYNGNPPNTIITVDDAIATQLLSGGVNATTNLTGGIAPAARPTAPTKSRIAVPLAGNTLGVIGDSREDAAFVPPIVAGSSTDVYVQSNASLKWALEISGQCFRRVADYSKSGSGMGIASNTLQAGARPTFPEQMASVLNDAPSHCWVRVPINDIFGGASADDVWAAFKPMVDTIVAAGIRVELVACTLLDSTKGSYTTAQQANIIKLNDKVRAEYGSNGAVGVVFHDTANAAMLQGAATYAGITGAYADYVHFQNIGAFLEGSLIGQNWLARFRPLPLLGTYAGDAYRGVPADNNSLGTILGTGSNNYLSNGTFDLGTPVSGVAQGWSVVSNTGCTYVASIVAAPAFNGNTDGKGQQLVVTYTAANAFLKIQGPNMIGDVQLMKRYIAAAIITVAAGGTNLRNVRMELQVASPAATLTFVHGRLITGDDTVPAMNTNGYQGVALADLDLALRPDLVTTGGATFRLAFVISGGAGTSGSSTVTFSRAACRLVN